MSRDCHFPDSKRYCINVFCYLQIDRLLSGRRRPAESLRIQRISCRFSHARLRDALDASSSSIRPWSSCGVIDMAHMCSLISTGAVSRNREEFKRKRRHVECTLLNPLRPPPLSSRWSYATSRKRTDRISWTHSSGNRHEYWAHRSCIPGISASVAFGLHRQAFV